MIEYRNITISFNNQTLLSDFSLHIGKGEKVVLWGASGSGKSTLMSLIPGFNTPAKGSVFVNGLEVNANSINQIRRQIAWVPQNTSLPVNTVKEFIHIPFSFKANKQKAHKEDTILDYFKQLGLQPSIYEKQINEISGGELQRISIVTAALLEKPVLLLDEPTSALDAESIGKLITFLKKMKDTAILAISHDANFTESFDKQIKLG